MKILNTHDFPATCACRGGNYTDHRYCACDGCPGDCWCSGYDDDLPGELACNCGYVRLHYGYCCMKYLAQGRQQSKTWWVTRFLEAKKSR